MSSKVSEAELLRISSMIYKDKWYDKVTEEFTVDEFNNGSVTFKVLGSTAVNKSKFESKGLQASYLEVNGQKVIAFRGSQGIGSKEGNKDWAQDLGLNSPDGYLKDSQFKAAEKWIASLGLSKEELKNIIFTGHSLGGGLGSWAAVKYDAKGVVFSAPSTYNMLTPDEKMKIKNADVTNFYQFNDSIPDVPAGVPRIGKQIVVQGSPNSIGAVAAALVGAMGH